MSKSFKIENLDRDDFWHLGLIALVPLLAALPSLLGFISSDPVTYATSMTISTHGTSGAGLAHLLPGSPVIDGNNGGTTQALGYRAANEMLHARMPWWNAYSGVGLPLAAEYQPAAFFPLTFLLLLPQGVLLEHLLLQVLAGWGTYALLRQLGLDRLAAVTGGILFAFNGTLAWYGAGPCSLPLPFLPWMLLGIERAWTKAGLGLRGGWRILAVASALTLLAGFPEVAYLNALMTLAWAAQRFFQTVPNDRRAYLWRVALGGAVGIAVAAPQVYAFLQSLPLSFAMGHVGWTAADKHIIAMGVVPSLIAPYIFGPIYGYLFFPNLFRLWTSLGGYVTAAMLVMAAYGVVARRAPLTLLLLGWIFLALGKMFAIQPIAFLWNLLPGMTAISASRYVPPTWSLAIVILAMYGLDDLVQTGRLRRKPAFVTAIVALVVISAGLLFGTHYWSSVRVIPGLRDWFVVSMVWVIFSVAACLAAFILPFRRMTAIAVAGLLTVEAVVMFSIPTLSNARGDVTVDMPAIAFLRQHLDLSRYYSLGSIPPNYSAYYGIASINEAYDPVAKRWSDWVATHLDHGTNGAAFSGAVDFSRDPSRPNILQELQRNLAYYKWVGVKYIVAPPGEISFTGKVPEGLEPQTLQILQAIRKIYADQAMTIYELPNPLPYFEIVSGQCKVAPRGRLKVATDCATSATLLRRELFYPGWNVRVDGKQASISVYRDLFQSVALPRGKSTVHFDYAPPHIIWMWLITLLGLTTLVMSGVLELRTRAGHGS
jgi:hypothetical protein